MSDLLDDLNPKDRGDAPAAPDFRSPAPKPPAAMVDPLRPISADRPLADRLRPTTLDEFVGQTQLLGDDALFRRLLERDQLSSMILWGPPGSGKTTLATIIARMTKAEFASLSAVSAGVKDVKSVIEFAGATRLESGQKTILFLDEIHRFNKAQQDALLPAVESGVVILIGATTENPSFSVVAPLLSRCRVFTLKSLPDEQMVGLLERALDDAEVGLGDSHLVPEEGALEGVVRVSDGDARRALNLLELAARSLSPDDDGEIHLRTDALKELCQREHLMYDKSGEEHFNIISALHKSLRSSDVQASVYWCERMLASGEDARYVARRMIRFASEDIGNADPQALTMALNALASFEKLGPPEGELALIQCAIYLATAPKSNAAYVAEAAAKEEIAKSGSLPVPFHIRNAPTGLMQELGYGKGYQYDHDAPDNFSGQECLPDEIAGQRFYDPNDVGFEREILKRMNYWDGLRKQRRDESE